MNEATKGGPRIEGGIEWYTYERDGHPWDECQCARCGSSAYPVNCWDCGGEGGRIGEDIGRAYDFGWIVDTAWYVCRTCKGKGGHWRCCSSREWCEANPMPGREHIASTASDHDDD